MIRFPPRRILVAYDVLDASRTAWRHAAALAARCGGELEAIYVEPWQPGVDLMPPPDLTPERARAIRARIRAVVGGKTKIFILQGDPSLRILGLARARRPDLIVVGTHGRTGLARALLGSVAEDVIRSSPVPVLAARGPVRPVRSISAPVNFTSYSEYGLAYAAGAAAILKARLTALHVSDDPIWCGNFRARLSRLFERLPPRIREACRPKAEAAVGEATRGILQSAKGHDWFVLVAHKTSFVRDALLGTTAERVLRRSPIPVLAVPAPKRPFFALGGAGGRGAATGRALTLR